MVSRCSLVSSLAVIALLLSSALAGAAPAQPDIGRSQQLLLPEISVGAAVVFPPVTEPDPLIRDMIGWVDPATLYQYVGDLSGAWPVQFDDGTLYTIRTRYTTSGTPIQRATEYAANRFTGNKLQVEQHRWGPSTAPNVIGTLTGESRAGDIYMITAHLDSTADGTSAPGAHDNASGSVAVLVASDILAPQRWDCTVRFALFTGEEQGILGSDAYAKRARQKNENILGVINLDMLGWNTGGSPPEIDLHATTDLPVTRELAEQFASVVSVYGLNLLPEVLRAGTGASDQASFWEQHYPAILGIEDYYPSEHDFNPYYHTTQDTLAHLDMAYYAEFVRAAVASLAHMAGCLVRGPEVSPGLSDKEVQLQWTWDMRDAAYEVHRSTDPYFNPVAGTLLKKVVPMLPNPVTYRDEWSGAGDPDTNHFYVVRGMKDERGAMSNRTGEFDFTLRPGG